MLCWNVWMHENKVCDSVILASEQELIVVKKTFLSPPNGQKWGGYAKKKFRADARIFCPPQFQTRGAALEGTLVVPRVRAERYGPRGFSVSGPHLWNSLYCQEFAFSARSQIFSRENLNILFDAATLKALLRSFSLEALYKCSILLHTTTYGRRICLAIVIYQYIFSGCIQLTVLCRSPSCDGLRSIFCDTSRV